MWFVSTVRMVAMISFIHSLTRDPMGMPRIFS